MQTHEQVSDPDGDMTIPSGMQRAVLALLTGTTHLVALVEADGTVVYVGPSVRRLLGYDQAALVGRNVADYIHPEDLEMASAILSAEAAAPRSGEFSGDDDVAGEYRMRHGDGRWVPFEFVRNNFLSDPTIGGILVLGRPVEARYALDEALGVLAYDAEGTDALRHLLQYLDSRIPGGASAVLVTGPDREWVAGPALSRVLGSRGPWDLAVQTGFPVWADVDDPHLVEPLLARAAAQCGFSACWCMPLPVRHPQVFTRRNRPLDDDDEGEATGCLVVWSRREKVPPVGFVGVMERVGGLAAIALGRRREQRRLRRMVDYDQATGALTRVGMEAVVERSGTTPRTHLLFDLDDFKEVNDRYGHSAGDEVLRRVVARVQQVLRSQDLLVRIGGDEFLVLLADTDPDAGRKVADRLAAVVAEPVTVGGVTIRVGTSVGIAPWDPDVPFGQLTDRADRAMYRAKEHGKGCWAVWEPPAS